MLADLGFLVTKGNIVAMNEVVLINFLCCKKQNKDVFHCAEINPIKVVFMSEPSMVFHELF